MYIQLYIVWTQNTARIELSERLLLCNRYWWNVFQAFGYHAHVPWKFGNLKPVPGFL